MSLFCFPMWVLCMCVSMPEALLIILSVISSTLPPFFVLVLASFCPELTYTRNEIAALLGCKLIGVFVCACVRCRCVFFFYVCLSVC